MLSAEGVVLQLHCMQDARGRGGGEGEPYAEWTSAGTAVGPGTIGTR